MNSMRGGTPPAVLLTFLNVLGAWQFGVPIWEVGKAGPLRRVDILFLAASASACLCHAWAHNHKIERLQRSLIARSAPSMSEVADV